jgi:chromosome segregation ATPase
VDGAFRSSGAAIERAAALADENERLKAENAELRARAEGKGSSRDLEDLRAARRERDELRAQIDERNAAHVAAVQRLRDEAKEQHNEVRAGQAAVHNPLLDDLSRAERQIAQLHRQLASVADALDALAERLSSSPPPPRHLADTNAEVVRHAREVRAELAKTARIARAHPEEGFALRFIRRLVG